MKWWRNLNTKRKAHFILNIIWGVFIAVAIHFMHQTEFGMTVLNTAYDFLVINEFKKEMRSPDPNISEDLVFIEFDEETYSESNGIWTPRRKLAQVMEKALASGAGVVVADFSLEKKLPRYLDEAGKVVDENAEFISILKKVVERIRRDGTGQVIILPKRIRAGQSAGGTIPFFDELENLVNSSGGIIRTGILMGLRTPSDNVVREWKYFERLGGSQGEEDILLSAQIIAVAAYCNDDLEAALKDLKRDLLSGKDDAGIKSCDGNKIMIRGDNLSNRYRFQIAPRALLAKEGVDDPLKKPYDRRLSAAWDLPESHLKDKLVVIGSSFSEMGDVHFAPVGEMTGMYLVGNGINILLLDMQPRYLHPAIKVFVEAVIILFAALIFLELNSFLAMIVLSVAVLITFVPLSTALFKYGIVLDFWFPIVGIGMHETVVEVEGILKDAYYKWRRP